MLLCKWLPSNANSNIKRYDKLNIIIFTEKLFVNFETLRPLLLPQHS